MIVTRVYVKKNWVQNMVNAHKALSIKLALYVFLVLLGLLFAFLLINHLKIIPGLEPISQKLCSVFGGCK